ncbi:MAG: UDP-3-O-acyl-N-acetylglucosamine deacetylase [Candidatus Binatus sp.]|uniref:UDP-3-O-acyl-N-acetylglucosamine deacetylase n=1 Tax=Candidatus Binatus sp. TaxID=2811406 RepID=UPI00271E862F|nr:UDP-3-O-acyl-N-acetylglucosamine deacetylase [Candidatus Binatus sp.]MDO8433185.1 UDP-3-O-acyl-N-acetylglucosamine deacetylase [Candidatus Binatus sp.]
MNETVLVVDDEERIRSSLRGILSDEGFRVVDTGNAPRVMDLIASENPAIVLLDVWMPEMDGIELLRRIKAEQPRVPVIMISGHANIQNAVAATKLGAADFIQKPFSVSGLLGSIARALEGDTAGPQVSNRLAIDAEPQAARRAAVRAGAIPQRTLARSIVMGGQGLHTGLKTGVILHPSPQGFGIVFSSLADETAIPARLENVTDTGYNTTLTSGGRSVRTVEHLMSAMHAFGIVNLLVKTDDEVPALDGSALEFCKQLSEAGVAEQDAIIEPIRIARKIVIGDEGAGREFIKLEPANHLVIDYTLDYPKPIGVQHVHFELTSPEAYAREIAPARTFGFVREFRRMAELGLASGGRLDNLILVDDEKVVNTTLRFADEFARHKVLDLIGDLYLLGRPLYAHVTASKTGHSDNLAMVKAIRNSLGG